MQERRLINSDVVTVVIVVLITLTAIVLATPVLRDFLVARMDVQIRDWLAANRITVIAWNEWSRLVFEVALALFISNQVFNEQLRKWFESASERLKAHMQVKIEQSVKQDDSQNKIKKAFDEILAFLLLPFSLRGLLTDIPILVKAQWTIYQEVRIGMPNFFVRLLALKILNAFSGKLHATAALLAFWGVLFTKVLKLYLDSPALLR